MYTVYVLYSPQFSKSYVGYTSDLAARLISHNMLGHKGWTLKYRPWELVYTEEFNTKKEAMDREKWFKSGVGREFIQARIQEWMNP